MIPLVAALSLVVASPGVSSDDEVRAVADSYLRALTGNGDDRARELLLGGASMDAAIFTLDSARVVSREPVRREEGNLEVAAKLMRELDQAGRRARAKLLSTETHSSGMGVVELSQAEAAKLLEPTREKAQKFLRTCPVLSSIARVGKEVYWHPRNPIRGVLDKAGGEGRYQVELHRFKIESLEGPNKVPRQWPLRVVRFRSAEVDTGWRILPASDWSVE
jgi:hypothetical protein